MLQRMDGGASDRAASGAHSIYRPVDRCRICDGLLRVVVDLGEQALASRFPTCDEPDAPRVPLTLCVCPGCGLAQLGQSVDGAEMWRDGYGYASGINETMRAHLGGIVGRLAIANAKGHVALDIGCNDGTLLKEWARYGARRIGFDPIASPVEGAEIVREYFSARRYRELGFPQADTVTSIAMFYDLDDPVSFAKDVESILAPNGIWCLEVGYVGGLIEGAWDGLCHEHVTYYGLTQIKAIADLAGLTIRNVSFNTVNGGSMQVWLARSGRYHGVDGILHRERRFDFGNLQREIELSAKALRNCIRSEFAGKRVYALGASTKGNTLLQASYLTSNDITAAVDRNPAKWGRRLPGTNITIISEDEARANPPPHAFLVLPWHFREQLLQREHSLHMQGVKFIFPLPTLEVV